MVIIGEPVVEWHRIITDVRLNELTDTHTTPPLPPSPTAFPEEHNIVCDPHQIRRLRNKYNSFNHLASICSYGAVMNSEDGMNNNFSCVENTYRCTHLYTHHFLLIHCIIAVPRNSVK